MTEHATDRMLPKAWWAGEHWALSIDAARELANITTEGQARIELPGIRATDTIEAVIPIVGLLGVKFWGFPMGSCYKEIREAVAAAEADPRVQSIRFEIDSPGGLVKGAHETAEVIALCKKPTKSVVLGNACSAAYWVGSQADEIEASPTAVIGSVGTTISFWAPKDRDDYTVDLVSSQSPRKSASVRTEDGRSQWRDVLDAQAKVFIGDVARGRGVDYAEVLEGYGSGAILSAPAALEAGMIDTITGAVAEGTPSSSGDDDMQANNATAPADIAQLQAELDAAKEQNAALKAQIDEAKAKEQADALSTAQAQLDEAKAALEAARAEADALKVKLEEAEAAAQQPTPAAATPEEVSALQQQLDAAKAELEEAQAAPSAGDEELAALREQLAAVQAELDGAVLVPEPAAEAQTDGGSEPAAEAAPPSASEEIVEAPEMAALREQLAAVQAELSEAKAKHEEAAKARADEKAAVQAQLDAAQERLAEQKAAAARDLEIEKLFSRGLIAPSEKALAAHTHATNPELFAEVYASRTTPVVELGAVVAHGHTPPANRLSPRQAAVQRAKTEAKRRGIPTKGPAFVALLNAAQMGQL